MPIKFGLALLQRKNVVLTMCNSKSEQSEDETRTIDITVDVRVDDSLSAPTVGTTVGSENPQDELQMPTTRDTTTQLNQNGKRSHTTDVNQRRSERRRLSDPDSLSEFLLLTPLEAGFPAVFNAHSRVPPLSCSVDIFNSVEYVGAPSRSGRRSRPAATSLVSEESSSNKDTTDEDEEELSDIFLRSTLPSIRLKPRRSFHQIYDAFLQETHLSLMMDDATGIDGLPL